jgi:hypothetical protein
MKIPRPLTKLIIALAINCTLLVSSQALTEEEIKGLADMGSGVHRVKLDKGKLISCVVVGQERISTTLGVSKGMQVAKDKARLNANKAFVQWLKSEVKSVEKSANATALVLKGSEGSEGNTLSEQGESVEVNTSEVEVIAQGMVKGLSMIGAYTDEKTKTQTAIFGWKPDFAQAANDAAAANQSSATSGNTTTNKASTPESTANAPMDRGKIETKSTVAPNAGEF